VNPAVLVVVGLALLAARSRGGSGVSGAAKRAGAAAAAALDGAGGVAMAVAGGRTWSAASAAKRATLDPRLQRAVDLILGWALYDLTIVSGRRSNEEQAALYAQGRTTPGDVVTYKKPGTSKHNATPALAVDVAPWVGGRLSWNAGDFDAVDFPALAKRATDQLRAEGLLTADQRVVSGAAWKMKDRPHLELAGPGIDRASYS